MFLKISCDTWSAFYFYDSDALCVYASPHVILFYLIIIVRLTYTCAAPWMFHMYIYIRMYVSVLEKLSSLVMHACFRTRYQPDSE